MAWHTQAGLLLITLFHLVHLTIIKLTFVSDMVHLDSGFGNSCVFYRPTAEDKLLLWNTSDPPSSSLLMPDDLRNRTNVSEHGNVWRMYIDYLRLSDSGDYRWECWDAGKIISDKRYNVSVCHNYSYISTQIIYQGRAELQCDRSSAGQQRIIWWQMDYGTDGYKPLYDTDRPLESHLDDVGVPLKISKNGSILSVSNFTRIYDLDICCQVLHKKECLSLQCKNLFQYAWIFTHVEGDTAVLPCIGTNLQKPVYWETKGGFIIQAESEPTETPSGPSDQEEMYVMEGSRSGNHSLVIPSVSFNHTGLYRCISADKVKSYAWLSVCIHVHSYMQTYSPGDQVAIICDTNVTQGTENVIWYRWTDLQSMSVLADLGTMYEPKYVINTTYTSKMLLIILNISLEDRGQYWCVVSHESNCVSASKTDVQPMGQKDMFGVDSTFYRVYASLLGCVLLGMGCAVVVVLLKTRRRDSGTTTVEEERRDAPLDEELSEAEDRL